jgi:hypothetical protein
MRKILATLSLTILPVAAQVQQTPPPVPTPRAQPFTPRGQTPVLTAPVVPVVRSLPNGTVVTNLVPRQTQINPSPNAVSQFPTPDPNILFPSPDPSIMFPSPDSPVLFPAPDNTILASPALTNLTPGQAFTNLLHGGGTGTDVRTSVRGVPIFTNRVPSSVGPTVIAPTPPPVGIGAAPGIETSPRVNSPQAPQILDLPPGAVVRGTPAAPAARPSGPNIPLPH